MRACACERTSIRRSGCNEKSNLADFLAVSRFSACHRLLPKRAELCPLGPFRSTEIVANEDGLEKPDMINKFRASSSYHMYRCSACVCVSV